MAEAFRLVVRGHFNGEQVILDGPVPPEIEANTPVTVHFEVKGNWGRGVLEELARLARPGGMPSDFAAQHDHSIRGLPKR